MKRGDVVIVAARGAFSGKPRPAVVVQTDLLNPTHTSVILAPLTTDLRDALSFRVRVEPTTENGLREAADVMVDKLLAVPRAKVHRRVGELDVQATTRLDRALAVVLGLAGGISVR